MDYFLKLLYLLVALLLSILAFISLSNTKLATNDLTKDKWSDVNVWGICIHAAVACGVFLCGERLQLFLQAININIRAKKFLKALVKAGWFCLSTAAYYYASRVNIRTDEKLHMHFGLKFEKYEEITDLLFMDFWTPITTATFSVMVVCIARLFPDPKPFDSLHDLLLDLTCHLSAEFYGKHGKGKALGFAGLCIGIILLKEFTEPEAPHPPAAAAAGNDPPTPPSPSPQAEDQSGQIQDQAQEDDQPGEDAQVQEDNKVDDNAQLQEDDEVGQNAPAHVGLAGALSPPNRAHRMITRSLSSSPAHSTRARGASSSARRF
ncbi:hypothetical protein ACH5RR_027431 [Cinchona calisaya]|uniref:Uncharacterized protein n=1 Tax=Cinchona calisaya TaxID=153742 RepID=A0ABD2Z6K0_9GENT